MVAILCCLSLPGILSATASAAKPNVIVVMTDDQGFPELSVHGNPIVQTPHLDLFHDQSLRLIDYHVSPMCTPTRGQLMTGLDAARNGAINVSSGRALLRPEIPTMANYFGDAGYATGIYGKWHLGANYPFRPEDRGFQDTVWFPSSHIGSVPDFWGNDYFDDTYIRNGELEEFEGYCTDIFFDEAMSFMSRSAKSGKPFLAYIAPNTPHGPLIAKEEDKAAIAEIMADPKYDWMASGSHDYKGKGSLKGALTSYLGMVRNIDTNMGRLMEFLESEGLQDDTILIFKTDNGSTYGPRYYNAGMRGGKTELWDGGHRVPFFIRWPSGDFTEPKDIDGLTQVQDVLPTLLDLCGIETKQDFDGMSLAPVFRGESNVSEDRTLIINYSRMPNFVNYPTPYAQSIMTRDQAAVLWKGWRLLEDRELYNFETDPLQETNVIDQHPDVVKQMRSHLYQWWDEVGPTANEVQRVIIGSNHENPSRLTGCEWLDVFIDQQAQIRYGSKKSGYWLLDVAEAGEYEFELRRWPKEIDRPLREGTPDGLGEIPITSASIYISNYHHMPIGDKTPYGFEGLTKEVKDGDTAAVFTLPLEKGPMALHTWFRGGSKGGKIASSALSAYYVYVRRK